MAKRRLPRSCQGTISDSGGKKGRSASAREKKLLISNET